MKITRSVLAAVVAMTAWAAFGQDATRRALAEELLNRANVKESLEKTFAMVRKGIPAQLEQMKQATGQTSLSTNVASETEQLMDLLTKELSWDKMKEAYITLYAETFTQEELEGIIAFYKSPAGEAYVRKQPQLMQRSMELSQKLLQQVMPRIQALSNDLRSPVKQTPAASPMPSP